MLTDILKKTLKSSKQLELSRQYMSKLDRTVDIEITK